MTTTPPTPPGWYPDPQAPGYQRYWDGAQWTQHVAPLQGVPPQAPTGTSSNTVVMIIVGVIVGFVVLLVISIAAVTLLGSNAENKFSTIATSIN